MEPLSGLFDPYFPQWMYHSSEYRPLVRHFVKWRRTNTAVSNIDELLSNCFSFALERIDLPEKIKDQYSDFWLEKHDSTLRYMLSNDLLVASMVYMRNKTKPPVYSLAKVLNYSNGDYSNFAKNLREFVPPVLRELLGIAPTDREGYEIRTHYPNLVAAIIKNARASCFSKQATTRNSFKYNKSFFLDCAGAICGQEGQTTSYPDEEFYIFERLFSMRARLGSVSETYNLDDPGKRDVDRWEEILGCVRYLPNVSTRHDLTGELLAEARLGGASNISLGNALKILKFIGGYFYPMCQALFCGILEKKYHDDWGQMVGAIQGSLCDKGDTTRKLKIIDRIREQMEPTHTHVRGYASRLKSWNADWWSDTTPAVILSGNIDKDASSALFDSPIFDLTLISEHLNLD